MTNSNVKHKSSVYSGEYSFCDVCTFNGYPNERVVIVIHGFRSENEDGFVLKFTEYDFPIQKRRIHRHKFNEELIKTLVNQSLGNLEVHL
jgi:hypothetical protein